LRAALSIWRSRNRWQPLAQALPTLTPIAPVRDSRRTAGGPLGRSGTLFDSSLVERYAFQISSRDRAKIVASAQSALGLIRGKWKFAILVTMLDGPVRLGQLRRLIPGVSKKVLVQQLHELENDGIIERTDLSGKIKHVEYMVSVPLGVAVMNLLRLLSDWGSRHAPMMGLHDRTRIVATTALPIPVRLEAQPFAGSGAADWQRRPLVSTK
jgi:DNA-binding HxlR family transcriptional regulator